MVSATYSKHRWQVESIVFLLCGKTQDKKNPSFRKISNCSFKASAFEWPQVCSNQHTGRVDWLSSSAAQMPQHLSYHRNPWNWFFLSVCLGVFSPRDMTLVSLHASPSVTWCVCVACRHSFHASLVASPAPLINTTLCCCVFPTCVWVWVHFSLVISWSTSRWSDVLEVKGKDMKLITNFNS